MTSSRFFDRLQQDVRYGLRLLRRAPGLNAAVIAALALGIGATAATFSVVDAVLLRPLAYADADRLAVLLHRSTNPVSPANFLDWQRHASAFSSMGAAEYWTPNLGGIGDPEKLFALRLTSEVLPMLGVAPAIGRFPGTDEAAGREVVIGDGLWRRVFGGEVSILQREITLDGAPYVVVGVMPPEFKFAPFWATRAELWAPLDLRPRATQRTGNSLRVFARLAPGVSLDQARASMDAVTTALDAQYPGTNRQVTVTPLKERVVGDSRRAIVVLFAAVGLVLLIACANVAHMLLSRAAARAREIAVRAAVGAGRGRLIRQFLTESLVLAVAGGAGGLLLAGWAIEIVKALGATSLPRVQSIALDGRVLAFGTAVSCLTAVVFGLAPALRLSRPALTQTLRGSERGSSPGRRGRRVRHLLVVSEVALAVTLLVGAALLIRSFAALRAVDPGWNPEGLASMVVSVSGTAEGAPERRFPFYLEVLERLRALPGVQLASAINHVPLSGDVWGFPFLVQGKPEPAAGETPTAAYRVVLPGYFRTMGLPLVGGRDFAETDREGADGVVIVNEHLAQTHWPGESALGKRLRVALRTAPAWLTVVGVVRNAVRSDWRADPSEEMYLPLMQSLRFRDDPGPQYGYLSFVIRTTGDPAPLLPAARAAVRGLSASVAISDVFLMTEVVGQATMGARFLVTLLGAFAGIALLLTAVGLYGVMSYAVSNRRHEIGIRMALGATPRRIVSLIVGEGLTVALLGTVIGAGAAAIFGGLLSGLLYGVTPHDVPAFAIVSAALVIVAALACYFPARRASRIEPQQELR
jgi:putative ABC transport system permease protein